MPVFAETVIHSVLFRYFRYFVKIRPDVTKHVVEISSRFQNTYPSSLDKGIIFNCALFFLRPVKI